MCTHKHTEGEEGKWRNGNNLKINIWRDFPGSPAVETPGFWYRGHRFDPWLGNWDLICPVTQPKIKTKTNKQKFAEHLATWCKELTHWKRPWCWERSKAGGEGDDRGWDGWMTSLTQWTWVWVSSGSWWWTGTPGMLQSTGSQRVGHHWWTELIWTDWQGSASMFLLGQKTPVSINGFLEALSGLEIRLRFRTIEGEVVGGGKLLHLLPRGWGGAMV